ncbi:hypothetical protein AALP_AA1G253900 [Arabis alpina]|uniref:Uncharacterized protein n=1 Tax=Arabis alpina TaxID=50452 RepID=A0A087HQL2_ARAAL|nr:hypothetical protein AALP_AA1G253900 [Arabis alpina]
MSDFGFYYSGKDNSAAVEDLLSQAKDLYVLEQVAAINCSAFTDSSSLPTNLETRFRRLKSLPVSRPDQVSSSNNKLLSHSKTMSSAFSGHEKRNPSKLASPSQALGCLFPSPSKETKKKSKSSEELLTAEEQKRKMKIAMKESKRRQREVDRVIRKSRQALRSYV